MLEPRIVERESFTVVGVGAAGQLGEFNYGEIWEKQYMPMDALLKSYSTDGGSYGLTFGEGDHLVYLAGVAAAKVAELPAGTRAFAIPAAKYAVFECVMSTLTETVQEVYGQWFHTSGFELDHRAVGFEYYLPYDGVGEMRVEIYVPIQPKEPAFIVPDSASMKVFDTIAKRRSIRKFKPDPIPEDTLRQIIQAGLLAPSGKNNQPWKFYVVRGEKITEMLAQMRAGITRSESQGHDTGSAKYTIRVMEQAPVTVLIYNRFGTPPWITQTVDQNFSDLVNLQSIGAAIQNMILTAEELGLGSLWICDVFSAYEELGAWLGEPSALIAAISLGFADEHPVARKRKDFDELVHWA
jgi:nitroreductase/predicted transcriptional regulator YdeE